MLLQEPLRGGIRLGRGGRWRSLSKSETGLRPEVRGRRWREVLRLEGLREGRWRGGCETPRREGVVCERRGRRKPGFSPKGMNIKGFQEAGGLVRTGDTPPPHPRGLQHGEGTPLQGWGPTREGALAAVEVRTPSERGPGSPGMERKI